MNLSIERYDKTKRQLWDEFVKSSRNGTFLFERDFMEYHSDRFDDFSLMAYQGDRLLAVLPANLSGTGLVSHGGLTFGGWVTGTKMRTATMLSLMNEMIGTMRGKVETITYKAVPSIYHRQPAQEDLYALWRCGANLVRRDVSSAIYLRDPPNVSSGRREGVRKALRTGLQFGESEDLGAYHRILSEVLARHDASPVHTLAEMKLLKQSFPTQIRLYVAELDGQMLGGALCFDNGFVAHTQYLANSSEGREVGALDLVLHELANDIFKDREYLSFGTSVESGGRVLNEGLIAQKEGFGGRAVVYDTYELAVV